MIDYDKHEEIKGRILARKAVEELLSYVPDVIKFAQGKSDTIDESRFWDLLATAAAGKEGKVLVPDAPFHAMGADEARKFEKELMPYGMHKGEEVGDTPVNYLLFLVESEFSVKLRRYVKSKLFQDRQ